MRDALLAARSDPHPGAAPGPIRILIVDDSVVARAVLARMLGERAGFAVVGQADGVRAAMAILAEQAVDIILLDLEMPGIDGLRALPELIASSRGARVLVVSSACGDGGAAAVAALRLGAADTMLKPSAAAFSARFADELADRLRRIVLPGQTTPPAAVPVPPVADRKATGRLECLAIGASTGGVHALAAFFRALPAAVTAPILVTQHLPAPFMPYYAAQLAEITGRVTRLGAPGLQPMPGQILLAPGDAHLTLVRTGPVVHVRLERQRAPSGCLPSVDPMFASVGALYGAGAVGVVLSGMGRDGLTGAQRLTEAGGAVLAQDAESSVVWGMPGAIANAGLARAVLPPDGLARRVADWSGGGTTSWT